MLPRHRRPPLTPVRSPLGTAFATLANGLALVAGFSLAIPPHLTSAQQPDLPPDTELLRLAAAWDHTATAASLALDDLPRHQFELAALQRSLGTGPDEIFQWVRTSTRWVPYTGALKGPQGTLLARQGNTLDRALLLADLLTRAGHQTRIANGTPSPRRLPDLVSAATESLRTTPTLPPAKPAIDPETRFTQVATALGLTPVELTIQTAKTQHAIESFHTAVDTATARHTAALRSLLTAAELPGSEPGATSPADTDGHIRKTLTDTHFWVQIKPADAPWRNLDLFSPTGSFAGLVVVTGTPFAPSDVPDKFCHHLTLRVVTTSTSPDGKPHRQVPLEHRVTTHRTGIGEFSLNFLPPYTPSPESLTAEALSPSGIDSFRKRLAANTEWVPVITVPGAEPIAASGFDAAGNLIPNPFAPGRQIGRGVNAATGFLTGLIPDGSAPPPDTTSTLTRVQLEFVTSAPGSTDRSHTRTIYAIDPTTPPGAEPLRRSAALTRASQFLVQTGAIPTSYASSVQYERLLTINLAVRHLTSTPPGTTGPELTSRIASVYQKTSVANPTLHLLAARRSTSAPGSHHFITSPNILSLAIDTTLPQTGPLRSRHIIDIIANPVTPSSAGPADRFWRTLASGVNDTVLEAAILSRPDQKTTAAIDPFSAPPDTWKLVQSPSDPTFREATFASTNARDTAAADLAAGNWIVLAPPGANHADSWWRIDPATGTTLGILADRHTSGGAVFTEETMLLIRIALKGIIMFGGLMKCAAGSGSTNAKMLCATCVMISTMIGLSQANGWIGGNAWGIGSDAMTIGCLAAGSLVD